MSYMEKKSHFDAEKVENLNSCKDETVFKLQKFTKNYVKSSSANGSTIKNANMVDKSFTESVMNDNENSVSKLLPIQVGKQKPVKTKTFKNTFQIMRKTVQMKGAKHNNIIPKSSSFNVMEAAQFDFANSESLPDPEASSFENANEEVDVGLPKISNSGKNVNSCDFEMKSKCLQKRVLFLFRPRDHHIVVKKQGVKMFKCDICSGIYRQKFSLKRHFLRSHVNIKYISDADISNCKINIPDELYKQQDFQKEEKSGSVLGRKTTKSGNVIFLENNDSRVMIGLYKCHECVGITFDLESELKSHYASHPDAQKKKFSCDKCNAVFLKKQVLSRHLAAHQTKDSANICKKCGLNFLTKAEYAKHSVMHSTGKTCKYCSKAFSTCANRRRHERIHEGLKRHSCKFCDLRFSQSKDLDRHLRKKHIDLCNVCSLCPKVFLSKSDLKTHLAERHPNASGVKKSSESAKSAGNFKATHGVLPPIQIKVCTHCKKAFSSVYALLKHKNQAHASFSRKRRPHRRQVKRAVKSIRKVSIKKYMEEVAQREENEFYCNLSQGIADNLLNFLDGKASQLSLKGYNFSDQNELFNFNAERVSLPWSAYNFPNNFDVDYALQNRGQEIKSKMCDNFSSRDRCLYATGLNKISNSSDLSTSPVLNGNYTSDSSVDLSDTDSVQMTNHIHSCFAKSKSLEDRKKLIGRDVIKVYVCCVCKESFYSIDSFDAHRVNNHPNVDCPYIEIEGEKESPPSIPEDLCWQYLNPDGVYFSCSVPPAVSESSESTLKCTKCHTEYKTSRDLHSHIIECGGNENTPKFVRKPIQQKRIKRTMKNRMDLTIKLQPAKKLADRSQFYKNHRLLTTSMTCDKNYFITKPRKVVKSAYTLTYKSKNIHPKTKLQCITCRQEFSTEGKLKNHSCLHIPEKKMQSTTDLCNIRVLKKISISELYESGDKSKCESKVRSDSAFRSSGQPQLESSSAVNSSPLIESLIPLPSLNKSKRNDSSTSQIDVSENVSHTSTSETPEVFRCPSSAEIVLSKSNADHFQNSMCLLDAPSNTENAVDLTFRPKEQQQMSALDVAMQAASEYVAQSSSKRKRKRAVSSLNETVERLKKQRSAVTDSEMVNNDNSSSHAVPNTNSSSQAEGTKSFELPLEKSNYTALTETKKTFPSASSKNESISSKSLNQVTNLQSLNTLQPLVKEIELNNSSHVRVPNTSQSSGVFTSPGALSNEHVVLEIPESKLLDRKEHSDAEKVPKLLIKLPSKKDKKGIENKPNKPRSSSEKKWQVETNNLHNLPEHHNLINKSIISENSKTPKSGAFSEINSFTDSDISGNMLGNSSSKNLPNSQLFTNGNFTIEKVSECQTAKLSNISDSIDVSLQLTVVSSEKQTEVDGNILAPQSISCFPSNKDSCKPRRSSGSHGRISPSLERIVNSIKQKLQSQELDPPQQCVSWLEDEKFIIPSSTQVRKSSSHDSIPSNSNLSFTLILPNLEKTGLDQSINTSSLQNDEAENHSTSDNLVVETSKDEAPLDGASSFPSSFDSSPVISSFSAVKPESPLSHAKTETNSSENGISSSAIIEPHCPVSHVGFENKNSESVKNSSLNVLAKAESVISIDVLKNNNKSENSELLNSETSRNSFKKKRKSKLYAGKPTVKNETITALQKSHCGPHSPPVCSDETFTNSPITNDVYENLKCSVEAIPVPANDITNTATSVEHSKASLAEQYSIPALVPDSDHFEKSAVIECSKSEESSSVIDCVSSSSVTCAQEKNRADTTLVNEESEVSQLLTSKLKNKLLLALTEPAGDAKQCKRSSPRTSTSMKASENSQKKVRSNNLEMACLRSFRSKRSSLTNKTTSKPLSIRKMRTSSPPKLTTEFGKSLADKMREKMKFSVENTSLKGSSENQGGPSHDSDALPNGSCVLSTDNLLSESSCENEVTVKSEFEKDDCTKKHSCPYCMLEFAYLTNFRRHIKTCKEKTENMEAEAMPSSHSSLLQYLPKKDEVEESMLNLLRHQSRQTQMMKEAERSSGSQVKGFQTYSCSVCHRIYLSLFKLLQHQVTHKLAKQDFKDDSANSECKGMAQNVEENTNLGKLMKDSVCVGEMDVKASVQTPHDDLLSPVKAEKPLPNPEVYSGDEFQNRKHGNETTKKCEPAEKQNIVCKEENKLNISQELSAKEVTVIARGEEKNSANVTQCEKGDEEVPLLNSSTNKGILRSESMPKQEYSFNSLKQTMPFCSDDSLLGRSVVHSDEKSAAQQILLTESTTHKLQIGVGNAKGTHLEVKLGKKSKKIISNKAVMNKTIQEENVLKDDKKGILLRGLQNKTSLVCSGNLKRVKKASAKHLKIEKKNASKAVKNSVSPKLLDVLPVKRNSTCSNDMKPIIRRGRPPKLSRSNHLKPADAKSTNLKSDKKLLQIKCMHIQPKLQIVREISKCLRSNTDQKSEPPVSVKRRGRKPASAVDLANLSLSKKIQLSEEKKVEKSCGTSKSFSLAQCKEILSESALSEAGPSTAYPTEDFRSIRANNKMCPVCKKKFPAVLLRNRHLQLAHRTKLDSTNTESACDQGSKKSYHITKTKNRRAFQRQCKKMQSPIRKLKKVAKS